MFSTSMLIGLGVVYVSAVVVGGLTTLALDSFMHYGHILGFVRWRRAFKSLAKLVANKDCSDLQPAATLMEEYERIEKNENVESFPALLERADILYWKIAAQDKCFTPFVCPLCMGIRITLFYALAGSVGLALALSFSLQAAVISVFGITFLSIITGVWFIGKLY